MDADEEIARAPRAGVVAHEGAPPLGRPPVVSAPALRRGISRSAQRERNSHRDATSSSPTRSRRSRLAVASGRVPSPREGPNRPAARIQIRHNNGVPGFNPGTPPFDQSLSLIRWRNRGRHTAIARAMRLKKTHYWPLVGTAFGGGAVDVAFDDAVVLNGYPGGPFT